MAVAAFTARDMLAPASVLRHGRDGTTRTALAEAGVSPKLVETFFRPFLSGVFLEDELDTSARFFHLVWRSMLRGTLSLPADGIGAVPAQLAARLPPRVLRTTCPVTAVTPGGVTVAGGDTLRARAVVVATGQRVAARLLPGLLVPDGRTVTTLYHATVEPPSTEPVLHVDARRRFLNTCVLTAVQPRFSADGRALVSTSLLGSPGPGGTAAVLSALGEVYGSDTGDWELLHQVTVPEALPAMPGPGPLSRRTRFGPGLYVCGDHRATGSLQGALASGTRAAREVLADLRVGWTSGPAGPGDGRV